MGSVTSQATGLAAARVLSVLASTACVPLAGRLVRHRGALACVVTAGLHLLGSLGTLKEKLRNEMTKGAVRPHQP